MIINVIKYYNLYNKKYCNLYNKICMKNYMKNAQRERNSVKI